MAIHTTDTCTHFKVRKKKTLNVICYPQRTKQLSAKKTQFKGVRTIRVELEFGSVGLGGQPEKKPTAGTRTNNKLNAHVTTVGGECAHHRASPFPCI